MSHREMRNNSGEILRQVADGESIGVTNHGELAALIVPPAEDPVAALVARRQARPARSGLDTLRSIDRRHAQTPSETILADVRGRW